LISAAAPSSLSCDFFFLYPLASAGEVLAVAKLYKQVEVSFRTS
jgi:hypothetical protein